MTTEPDRARARACPVCNGWVLVKLGRGQRSRFVRQRETTGLVCRACGWDYRRGEP